MRARITNPEAEYVLKLITIKAPTAKTPFRVIELHLQSNDGGFVFGLITMAEMDLDRIVQTVVDGLILEANPEAPTT